MPGTPPPAGAGAGAAAAEPPPGRAQDAGRAAAYVAVFGGLAVLALSTTLMLRRVEPFVTAYYIFAWYPLLVAVDGVVALTGGAGRAGSGAGRASRTGSRTKSGAPSGAAPVYRSRFLLLGRPRHALTMLAWSAVAWLFFELLNFRLGNWYYVFLPNDAATRWPSILISFATVFPAVFLAEAALAGAGVASRVRWPRLRVTPAVLRGVSVAGAVMFALPLLWPRWFFPLVWGGVVLLLEPINYRRDPARSLLGDLERGRPGRVLRLLLGGALIGLVWELFNIEARGKWIYTVPGLEELKLFEMPPLGFLGFPPFALECFAIWQALVLGGVAVPRDGRTPAALGDRRGARTRSRIGAALAAVAFAAAVLYGMERRTISSYVPRLEALPGVPAERLERAGYDAFSLAETPPGELVTGIGAEPARAIRWVETARLATLRGIGARNTRRLMAAGIYSVDELAAADPDALAARLRAISDGATVPARVRVWVRAARSATHEDGAGR